MAFRQEVPRAADAGSVRVRAVHLNEHAASMFAPTDAVGRGVNEPRQRRQRRNQSHFHEPRKTAQQKMQNRGLRGCAHPDVPHFGPLIGQQLKVRHVDQRELARDQRHFARRCNREPPCFPQGARALLATLPP